MEAKKINLSFGIVAIALLLMFYIVIRDYNRSRVNDYKEYLAMVSNIVMMKNNKIRELSNQVAIKQHQIDDLKSTLTETRNSLNDISTKLAPTATK